MGGDESVMVTCLSGVEGSTSPDRDEGRWPRRHHAGESSSGVLNGGCVCGRNRSPRVTIMPRTYLCDRRMCERELI